VIEKDCFTLKTQIENIQNMINGIENLEYKDEQRFKMLSDKNEILARQYQFIDGIHDKALKEFEEILIMHIGKINSIQESKRLIMQEKDTCIKEIIELNKKLKKFKEEEAI
jgi:peroxiredoxin